MHPTCVNWNLNIWFVENGNQFEVEGNNKGKDAIDFVFKKGIGCELSYCSICKQQSATVTMLKC